MNKIKKLTKDASQELLRAYFGKIFELRQGGEQFPVKIGYPRKELLQAAGYSAKSGTVSDLKKRYPEHFYNICRIACISPEFARLRFEQGKVRQLEIQFKKTNGGL